MEWSEILLSGLFGSLTTSGLFTWWLTYRKDKELQAERLVHETKIKEILHTHQLEVLEIQRMNAEKLENFKTTLIRLVETEKSEVEISKAIAIQHLNFEYKAAHDALKLVTQKHNAMPASVTAIDYNIAREMKLNFSIHADEALILYFVGKDEVHELAKKYINFYDEMDNAATRYMSVEQSSDSESLFRKELNRILNEMEPFRLDLVKNILNHIKGYRTWKDWVVRE